MVVYNTKEFLYLKPKKSVLQTFKATTDKTGVEISQSHNRPTITTASAISKTKTKKKLSLWNFLKSYFEEYCSISSIHCFHYFTSNKLKYYEKTIWFFIVIATTVCCTVVYFDLAELYYGQRVQTTVAESAYPIFMVPFPSVGVCLRNRIDWHRLNNEASKRFLPASVDNQTLNTFRNFFESLADIKFYTMNRIKPLFDPAANINLSLIDNVNILEVMEYLTFPCSQIFNPICMWRYERYNCCDLFTLERTEMGYCYMFNSAVSPTTQEKAKHDPYYPLHNSYSGEGSGLEVDILLNENKMKPGTKSVNGLYVMIKKSEEWHDDVKFINYNTFTKLALTAQITETDKRVRHISPVKRRCFFEDESTHALYRKIPGLSYWRANCRTRCHQEYVLKHCKCNLNLLFPDSHFDNFTSCKPSDFKCIYNHASLFSKETHLFESKYIHDTGNESMICNCLNSCNQIWYQAYYTSFPLEGTNSSMKIKMVHLDVHYQASYILKYRTSMRYTIVELLANFGGIIGLFLGASLLSAIELIYYLTFGLYIRLQQQFEQKHRHKSSNTESKPKMVKIAAIAPRGVIKF